MKAIVFGLEVKKEKLKLVRNTILSYGNLGEWDSGIIKHLELRVINTRIQRFLLQELIKLDCFIDSYKASHTLKNLMCVERNERYLYGGGIS